MTRTHPTLIAMLALAALCASPLRAQYLQKFSSGGQDMHLAQIFRSLAVIGRFNVIVSPTIRGMTTFDVSDITAEDALHLLAATHGLRVQLAPTRGRNTYVVAPPDVIRDRIEEWTTQIIRLRFQDSEELLPVLKDTLADTGILIRALNTRNTILLRGAKEQLPTAVDLVNFLDLPSPTCDVELTVFRDGKRTWFTTLQAEDGHELKAVVGPEDTPGSASVQYLSVEMTPSISPDRLIQIEADIRLSPPRGSAPDPSLVYNTLSTSTRFRENVNVDLASLESPTGQILRFQVRVRLHETELPDGDGPPLPPTPMDLDEGFGSVDDNEFGNDLGGLGGDLGGGLDDEDHRDLGGGLGDGGLGGDLGDGLGHDLGDLGGL